MIMKEPKFWKYLIFDDDCNITGVEPEVPEDIKSEYQAWVTQQENDRQALIKN